LGGEVGGGFLPVLFFFGLAHRGLVGFRGSVRGGQIVVRMRVWVLLVSGLGWGRFSEGARPWSWEEVGGVSLLETPFRGGGCVVPHILV